MDERRGRAVAYLAGTGAASVGAAFGIAWWAGLVVAGLLVIVGVVIGAKT